MKLPRYAVLSIALDTQAYRGIRPEVRDGHANYLLQRLLCGDEVSDVELERLGWKVTVREATSPEIVRK
jgi:hypothetical protein